jgi:hypothetical protein
MNVVAFNGDVLRQLATEFPLRGDVQPDRKAQSSARNLPQVLVRQARKNRLVYVILAEDRLVLPEAQAPQPEHNVHDGAHNQWCAHHRLWKRGCPGWRWGSQGFATEGASEV